MSRPEFEPVPARVWVIEPIAQTIHHARLDLSGLRDGQIITLRAGTTLMPIGGWVPPKGHARYPEIYRLRQLRRDGRATGEWSAYRIWGDPPRERTWWRRWLFDVALMVGGSSVLVWIDGVGTHHDLIWAATYGGIVADLIVRIEPMLDRLNARIRARRG